MIKKQKQDNKQSDDYQVALAKCTRTKEKLTMKDYHALLKQASVKGDSALNGSDAPSFTSY
jgi:hypothetical protein